jgi:hypothetical protein
VPKGYSFFILIFLIIASPCTLPLRRDKLSMRGIIVPITNQQLTIKSAKA